MNKIERLEARQLNRIVDRDAVAIGNLYRKARSSAVDSMRYIVEAGEKLIAKKAILGHGEWVLWLAANAEVLGFDTSQTATKLMRAAKMNVDVHFDDVDEKEIIKLNRLVWGNPVRGTAGTGEFERYTPARYIELARAVMGSIDLDPASCKVAQKIVKATTFFTVKDDGLSQEWNGNIWLNPPYHRELGPKFIDKLVVEVLAGRATQAIVLTNNSTDTDWFVKAQSHCQAICFAKSRIAFLEQDGVTEVGPTQGQAFFYFGDSVERFCEEFCGVGFIATDFVDFVRV